MVFQLYPEELGGRREGEGGKEGGRGGELHGERDNASGTKQMITIQ